MRQLPKPMKGLLYIAILTPLIYGMAQWLGLGKYWWMFLLGGVVIVVLLTVFDGAVKGREKKSSSAFDSELRKDSQKAGASKAEVREAVKDLSKKWQEAADSLKQAGLSIYSLPWYLLIGEPQSGKSTTLKNSGLEFPVGGDALSGSGGTRNCDWWFANEAVILDTAGRFTFQEENAPDANEWTSFLKLLARHRKACPINGVLVVIPCTTLLEDTPEEMDKKAANIRSKLMNVQRTLEIRFPVFIMVTKGDRVLGFSDVFTRLDPVEQKQLFGWSSPDGPEKPYDEKVFEASFDNIVTRIHKLRLKFCSQEENVQNVDRFFVFPEELRALREPLKRYMNGIFQTTRYDEPFAFRGYYISSGVQQGKPIAMATRALLKTSSGEDAGVIESLESIFKKSRAYFIKDFYEKKVFPEQGLISRTKAALEREKKTIWAVRILSALMILLVVGGMIPAWITLSQIINPIKKTIEKAEKCAKGPCPVATAYGLTQDLQKHRDAIASHRFTMAMFLKGTKSNELVQLLTRVQQKLYFDGVVKPVLKDAEGRMAVLSWETYGEYQPFFEALLNLLAWRGYDTKVQDPEHPEVTIKAKDLKVLPFLTFARKAKGVKGGDRTQEIDDWVAKLDPTGTEPDKFMTQLAPPKPDDWKFEVPDPAKGVAKFEEFWTVANLARWDYRLQKGLEEWVRLYNELIGIQDPDSKNYLKRYVASSKALEASWKATSAHMASTRPGASGFPGVNFEEWTKNLGESYDKLIKWKPVAPSVINEERRSALSGRLKSDWDNLSATLSAFAYLYQTVEKKVGWTNAAQLITSLLIEVSVYSDLDAFALTDDAKMLPKVAQISSWPEKVKNLDEWQKKQESLKKTSLTKSTTVDGANPPAQLRWLEVKGYVDRTASIALILRTIPTMQEFFAASLRTGCPTGLCYQANFARMMIPVANATVSFAEQGGVISRPDIRTAADAVSAEEKGYLERFIDSMGGGFTGGGSGFVFPASAANARSWAVFLQAIASWNPVGGGGAAPAPTDTGNNLAMADIQGFVAGNGYLNPLLAYFQSRIEKPKAAKSSSQPNPELVAAATQFKQNVQVLSDQPLKAWTQLAKAQDNASLRGYHAFSGNPAIRNRPDGKNLKIRIEDHGANLIRDAISPIFSQRIEPLWKRLQQTAMGQYPFITETALRQERAKYQAIESSQRFGGGSASSFRLTLPTMSQADISGVLSDMGVVFAEFSVDPILTGQEPQFDFVGSEKRGVFRVAFLWDRYLSGSNALKAPGSPATQIGVHNIEVLAVDRPITQGRRFMGDRVGTLSVFEPGTIIRPSTDVKSGRIPPPYAWKLAAQGSPLNITGRNEQSGTGWTGALEITGGPLRLFYFVRLASEDRRENQDDKIWTIRVVIPDAEKPREPLEGVFELRFDEAMPPVISQ